MLFSILGWLIYGLIVGTIAKSIFNLFWPDKLPSVVGFLPTLLTGVVGSYIGGLLNFFLGNGFSVMCASGWIMGTIGAVIGLFSLYLLNSGKIQEWFK